MNHDSERLARDMWCNRKTGDRTLPETRASLPAAGRYIVGRSQFPIEPDSFKAINAVIKTSIQRSAERIYSVGLDMFGRFFVSDKT